MYVRGKGGRGGNVPQPCQAHQSALSAFHGHIAAATFSSRRISSPVGPFPCDDDLDMANHNSHQGSNFQTVHTKAAHRVIGGLADRLSWKG